MKPLRSLLPLTLAVALGTGCVIVTTNQGGSDPDMTLDLTFEGKGCAAAGISRVRLSWVSPSVGAAQEFSCVGDPMTIVVPSLAPGTYRVQLEGFTAADPNFAAYVDVEDLVHTVSGTHAYALDLVGTTEVVTRFTFGAVPGKQGMTCAEAGVATVAVSVDGSQSATVPCSDGTYDAAAFTGILAGQHAMSFEAFDVTGQRLYAATTNVTVNRGADNDFTINLLGVVKGGLEFVWNFGAAKASCQTSGVSIIDFTLVDDTGKTVFSTSAPGNTPFDCTQQPMRFGHDLQSSQLIAGIYTLSSIEGRLPNGVVGYRGANLRLYAPAGRTQRFEITLQ